MLSKTATIHEQKVINLLICHFFNFQNEVRRRLVGKVEGDEALYKYEDPIEGYQLGICLILCSEAT